MTRRVEIYDTTLRDGSQGEGISFSVQDKLLILKRLDEAGFHFVEGGWPGANPKDSEFFAEAKKVRLKHTKLVAFGSTCKANVHASEDSNLKMLVAADTPVITIFGKSWDLHVKEVFKVELEKNIEMIEESVKFLRSMNKQVIYDAEHFFDGYATNPKYAMKAIETAYRAGASVIVLCDTNGGSMPSKVFEIVKAVKAALGDVPLGIHTHNDSALGVANALVAVQAGVSQVQGTVNGIGERCGNCDLIPVIANLQLKLDYSCLSDMHLKELTALSRYVNEICNIAPTKGQPYVGQSAFAHKGGVHIDAVKKNPITYEHIEPSLVGNHRRHLVSEVGGSANILLKAEELGIDLKKDSPDTKKILEKVKALENEGYQFEGAEASVELLIRKEIGRRKEFFKASAEIKNERIGAENPDATATVKLSVKTEKREVSKIGDGPVDALGKALRGALAEFYPEVKEVQLDDYKVRIVNSKAGTGAKVRVVIEFHDKDRVWATVGVSTNIIEASWKALVDAYEYKLLKGIK